jgi:GNAT superfamily N-acetyltransferase
MENHHTDETLVIREMELGDAERVAALTGQLGYERTAADIEQRITELDSNRARQAAFVACVGAEIARAEIAGWIEVSIERRLQSPTFALIGGLVVSENNRGQGIGRQLCERAENWSWERGVAKIRVTSRSTRRDAHRFYVQNGYQAVKTSMVFEKKHP